MEGDLCEPGRRGCEKDRVMPIVRARWLLVGGQGRSHRCQEPVEGPGPRWRWAQQCVSGTKASSAWGGSRAGARSGMWVGRPCLFEDRDELGTDVEGALDAEASSTLRT